MGAKQLNIDFFTDGVGEVEFNCIDIPIAAACGAYEREKYFLYLLQISVQHNWRRKDGEADSLFRYIRNLGLKFETVRTDEDRLVEDIIYCINEDWPVLLPVTYYEMFFSSRYKRNTASHFLLVEGYIEENEILLLREELSFISSERLKEQKGLYPLRLKNDMVVSIWSGSREWMEERLKDALFIIKPADEPAKISGIRGFLGWMLNEYYVSEDTFARKLAYLSQTAVTDLEGKIFELRTGFHKYMYAFFFLLKRCISDRVEKSLFDKLLTLESEILEFREITISKFHISRIKGGALDLDGIRERSEKLNSALYGILKEIYENIDVYKKEDLEKEDENLACKSLVSASSCEDETIKGPVKVLSDNQEIWKSKKTETPHWLMFQFPEPVPVQEIIITHHNEPHKMTVDFSIQGSMDGIGWEDLDQIDNNDSAVTKHILGSRSYQYYRIYITLPALRNNAAIIKHVFMK